MTTGESELWLSLRRVFSAAVAMAGAAMADAALADAVRFQPELAEATVARVALACGAVDPASATAGAATVANLGG